MAVFIWPEVCDVASEFLCFIVVGRFLLVRYCAVVVGFWCRFVLGC